MNGTQEQVKEAIYTTTLPGLKIVVKPAAKEVIQGVVFSLPGKSIEFEGGFFRTTDPFIQRYIESKKYFGTKVIRMYELEEQEQARLEKIERGETTEQQVPSKITTLKSHKLNAVLENSKPMEE